MEVISNIPNYTGIGVYSIIDTETGKKYIGSSKNVRKRIIQHAKSVENGTGNKELCDAYKQGHILKCELLETIPYGVNTYFLLDRERFFIKQTPRKKLMNIAPPVSITEEQALRLLKISGNNSFILGIYKKKSQPIMPKPQKKYAKKNLKRVPLDLQLDKYEQVKAHAESIGESINGYINKAIDEKIERDGSGNNAAVE